MKTVVTLAVTCLFASQAFAQTQTSSLTDADKLQIAVQKICPVSGAELGSMGAPVKINAGEQTAFLCCKGCQGKQLDAGHWKTIQARMAKAQGTCPIMEEEVDSTMKFAVVNGQQIFVCCPPCIPKIQADPEASIRKVNASYMKFVAAERQAASDQLHVKAQGICPVSGQKLGSMGAPVKVKFGEKEIGFLCCNSCVGKEMNAEHWKTVQTNLAKAQGVCPVMEEPIDSSMKSTVVNGRKIFVCCPPCIEKIHATPAAFVSKLDVQIANGGKASAESTDGHDHATHKHDK